MADAALQRRDEAVVRLDLQRADDAARHDEAEGVDRIGRVRAQDHVAGRGDRLRHVGEAFLGTERRHDLRVGIELHAEAAGIIVGLGAAQAGNAARGRVAMRARVAHDLAQLVDDGLRRRQVGIAHAEIDDVGAARAGAGLQPVDLLEDIGRKAADLVKLFHVRNPGAGGVCCGAIYTDLTGQGRAASLALDDLQRVASCSSCKTLQALSPGFRRLAPAARPEFCLCCTRVQLCELRLLFRLSELLGGSLPGECSDWGRCRYRSALPLRPSAAGHVLQRSTRCRRRQARRRQAPAARHAREKPSAFTICHIFAHRSAIERIGRPMIICQENASGGTLRSCPRQPSQARPTPAKHRTSNNIWSRTRNASR